MAPKEFASKPLPSVDSLTALSWMPIRSGKAPVSKPDGRPFDVVFINRRTEDVQLWWMDRNGSRKLYAEIAPAAQKRQQTRPGAIWMIADKDGTPLGYFRVDDRTAKAVVPADAVD